jgi:DNA-binding transcriptional ArsR family regulator
MEEEFKVSKDLMKAISADTRTQILRALESRQMTASELSRHLDKHVTTVAEHLELLHESNLIERIERPGRKWIYYKLSKIGKQMLHPQSYKVILVLAISFISLSFGLLSIPLGFRENVAGTFAQRAALPSKQDVESLPSGSGIQGASQQPLAQVDLILPILFIAIAVVGAIYSIRKIRRDYSSFRVPE